MVAWSLYQMPPEHHPNMFITDYAHLSSCATVLNRLCGLCLCTIMMGRLVKAGDLRKKDYVCALKRAICLLTATLKNCIYT